MISDGEDTDGDGVIDDWWDYDPRDDDENGASDDLKGQAEGVSCDPGERPNFVHTSVALSNNDTRPTAPHGTQVAGVVVAQANGEGLVGVAPGCLVQPYSLLCGGLISVFPEQSGTLENRRMRTEIESLTSFRFLFGLNKGKPMRSSWTCENFTARDSISGEYINPIAAELDSAMTEGIVVVAASGNTDSLSTDPYFVHCLDGVISVGGLRGSVPWSGQGEAQGYGMTYGPWIDISAPAEDVATTSTFCTIGGCNSYYGLTATEDHGYDPFADGTSLASPQVAGAVALMLSVNPNLTPAAIKAKLKASVDPINYQDYPGLVGKAGTGALNFYKALTTYGDVPDAVADTTWADTLYVGGDIHTPSGKSLTLAAGTVVRIAQDDLLSAGVDTTQIEWRIEGEVVSQGTSGNPVIFVVYSDSSDSLWGPLAIVDNGQSLDFSHVEFRGLVVDHITSPAEGEVILADQPTTIEWSTDYLESGGPSSVPYELTVNLEFSKDNGANYDTIATGVTASLGSYEWTPSGTDATIEGKIRVTFIGPGDAAADTGAG